MNDIKKQLPFFSIFGFHRAWLLRSSGADAGGRSATLRTSLALMLLGVLFGTARVAIGQAIFATPVNVGSSLTQTVPVTVPLNSTVDTTKVEVLTLGSAGLDFTEAVGGAACTGQTCNVSVNFSPKYPGLRSGAVVLFDSSNDLLATQLIYGTGESSLSVMEAGALSTVAGNGHLTDDSGSGNLAVNAAIHFPLGTTLDGLGDLYYTDSGNNVIRMVDPSGNLTTVAGTLGVSGVSPNGTSAASAELNTPSSIVIDGAGNLYFADSGNETIREVVKASGLIYTVAGTSGTLGYTGDGGAATSATLNISSGFAGLALDTSGNLYIADIGNNVIRKVNLSSGIITTIAGSPTGVAGYSGDSGAAISATLNSPAGVFVTSNGSIYIADFTNNVVRMISPGGIITTVAGNGQTNYTGDGGLATQATLNHPTAVAVDAAGDLFIADSENNCVRKVNGTTQYITTIAGDGNPGYDGDGVDANVTYAELNKPYGIALDGAGDLYIADYVGLRVREVIGTLAEILYAPIKVTNASSPVTQYIENEGNATLNLSGITIPASPNGNAAINNSGITPQSMVCTVGTPLPVGSTCGLGIEFQPTVVSATPAQGQPIPYVYGEVDIASDSAGSPVKIDPYGESLSIFPTTTTVSAVPNPAGLGAPVTFTAKVVATGNPQALTGTVSFYDNKTGTEVLLGGAPQLLMANGTATLTIATLAVGTHPITAIYSGDSGDATSSSTDNSVPPYPEVIDQVTGVGLSSSVNPSTVYQNIVFTATVTPNNSGGSTPTGTVTFSADGNPLPGGPIAMSGGMATTSTALLGKGTHAITAVYSGDSSDLPATSASYPQVVNFAVSSTSVTSSSPNDTASVTTPVTFTATVSGVSGSIPTGNVIFTNGSTVLGTVGLNSSGQAISPAISTLSPGAHTITAAYQGDGDYAGSSASLGETIQQIATSATMSASPNPAVAGASVNFAVNITAASSTTPNLPVTGTVSLMEGATVLGSGRLTAAGSGPATATVTIPYGSFGPGPHAISAAYSGDTNYVASTSSAQIQITAATTNTQLSASPNPVIGGTPLTLTAVVRGNGSTPTGTVSFTDGATLLGAEKLNGGVTTLTVSTLSVGMHTIVATYNGDTNDSGSTSTSVSVVVQSATTSTTLNVSPNPADYGQNVIFTTRVAGNGGLPTGTVSFMDGGQLLQSVTLNNGTAGFSTAALKDGVHTLTAVYSGDANDSGSGSNTVDLQVLQTITLGVTSTSPDPSVARADIHFVATITPLQGIAPTGSITFLDGNKAIGTSPITGGTATFDTTTLAVGGHQIVAAYAGDAATEPLNSQPYSQTITPDGTSISVSASASPATFGAPLTFTAAASSDAGALSGIVLFEADGTTLGQGTLSNGIASYTTTALSPGVHSIVAAYEGDSNDQPTNSSPIMVTVERTTTTTVNSSQNPLLTLAPMVISATVANGGGSSATGAVSFTEDNVAIGTAQLVSGVASFSVSSIPVGNHTFSASYAGDAIDFTSSSAPFTETVQLRPTSDVLTSSDTSLTGGQQVTLISVLRWTGPIAPTGVVTFLDGTTILSTMPVDVDGVATVTALLSGTSASITSLYSGDANYAGSTSAVTTVLIGPAPDFSMALSPPTISMPTTQHTTVNLTLGSVKGFTDTFQLGCLGLPYAATCTFSSDTTSLPAGGTTAVTLTVDTGNPLEAGAQAKLYRPTSPSIVGSGAKSSSTTMLACFLPCSFLLGLVGLRFGRFRAAGGLLILLCLAGASSVLSGCASLNINGTPPGTYTFQVTAVGKTGVNQSIPLTMTITGNNTAN